MHLVAISRVRNEADVIEAFVRHTATVVDSHVIVDNGSTDDTGPILSALIAEGLALEVRDDPVPGTGAIQARVMTRLMREVASSGEGWVLPLDADEFIATDDGSQLAENLESITTPAFVPWRTFVPDRADDRSVSNLVERITHHLVAEAGSWKKVIVPFQVARRGELEVGNHDVVLRRRDPRRTTLDDVVLAHFPVRSAAQYAVKIAVGNLGHLASSGGRNGLGFHYIEPFELLRSDWQRFRDTFEEAALRFAVPTSQEFEPETIRDPFPYAGGPLRYTPDVRTSEPWRSILEYSAQLAREIADLDTPTRQRRRDRKSSRAWRARSQKRP